MKSTRYDGQELRRVLAGMVTDKIVCARIASHWKRGGLFDTPWANLVGGWCVKHLQKYEQAPNGQLQVIFEDWSKKGQQDNETVKGVERFLSFVSDEWSGSEPPSSEQLLDIAKHYFDRVKVRELYDSIGEDLEVDRPEEALARLGGVSGIELGVGSLIEPTEDYSAWGGVYDAETNQSLVRFPDPLGTFLGDTFCRESLVAFMGPDKSGKSWWLQECVFRALKGRCRVAYFEVGDLGRKVVLQRLGRRALLRPLRPGVVEYPIDMKFVEDRQVKVRYEKREFKDEISQSASYKALRKVCRGQKLLRLSCHPNSTISVEGIQSILGEWQKNDWVVDVVVVDYADILAPPSGVRESLDQIDETWKRLRRISQEMHCLVVTATQSSAAAYSGKQKTLGRRHFSGRKTKLAHVDGMLGINCTEADKELDVTRLNWVVRRNARFGESTTAVVVGCLDVACPAVRSLV